MPNFVVCSDRELLIVEGEQRHDVLMIEDASGQDAIVHDDGQPIDVLMLDAPDTVLVSAGEQGPRGAPGADAIDDMVRVLGEAGANLSGHRVVRLDYTSRYVNADTNNPMDGITTLGLTGTAAAMGAPLLVLLAGPMHEPTWSWIPDRAIYLGSDGFMTQSPDRTALFTRQVGTALTTTLVSFDGRGPTIFN
jgi:hypothetical protein